jgi:putative photosynthetic complex assembly protein 2
VASVLLPVLYALFVWWFSTGVILLLSGLPRRTWGWSLAGASALAVWSLAALHYTRHDVSAGGAYLAFTAGILLWAWHEVTFLLGALTGPRRTPLPADGTGFARFVYATQAVLWHELAIVLTLGLAILMTHDGVNQVGVWTFAVLWVMRLSAKLNLFLGVPKLNIELLPEHLTFIGSYFRQRSMNALFPVSVTLGTVGTTLLLLAALHPGADAHALTGRMLVAALLGLAVLEHWFMVLPLADTALWQWALKAREAFRTRRDNQPPVQDRRSLGTGLGPLPGVGVRGASG